MELSKLSTEELQDFILIARKELQSRKNDIQEPMNIREKLNDLISDEEKISRYNGGWAKKIVGIDKTKTNGYSILGDFLPRDLNKKLIFMDGLYVDCDIHCKKSINFFVIFYEKIYRLFTIKNNIVNIIQTDKTKDWAVNFWPNIENNL